MAIAVRSVGSVDHLLPQEVELADADAAVMPAPAREPFPGPEGPGAKGEDADDPDGHGGVVEVLRRDLVDGR